MSYSKKCKVCKGEGTVKSLKMDAYGAEVECSSCEGSGVELHTRIEEQYDDASELAGDKIFPDEDNFIDLEDD